MKCSNCQGEWTPPANQSLGKCPFCQADILQMLNAQAEVQSTEVILDNMLQAYGIDLLKNQQRLAAMIADLFPHDLKTKRMLLLSVRENIPNQLLAIQQKDITERPTHILALHHRLAEDAFLKEEVAEQIVSIWSCAMEWNNEESDESFQIVWHRGYCGFVNARNKFIAPHKYDEAYTFNEGLARVRLNGKMGYIDKQGKEIIPLQYENAELFNDGLAVVELNNKYGFIDKQGKEIIPIQYENALSFSEGLASVKLDNKYGFIDKQGTVIVPIKYDDAESFEEGIAKVQYDYRWGFIDEQENEIIPLKYENVSIFEEGLAKVQYGIYWGFIDKQGRVIVPIKYDDANLFKGGLARVKLYSRYGLIDKTGEEVTPIKYENIFPFKEGLACVELNEYSDESVQPFWTKVYNCGVEKLSLKSNDFLFLFSHRFAF